MKNRLFPIIIGLCLVSLIGVAFLRILRPKSEAPVKPTEVSQDKEVNPLIETDALSETFGSDVDVAVSYTHLTLPTKRIV